MEKQHGQRVAHPTFLSHAGAVSHDDGLAKAEREYERWYDQQAALPSPVEQHFDQAIKEIKRLEDTPSPQTPKSQKRHQERRGRAGDKQR
ncbi:MAG: hypothetical protein JW993_09450 [Sedimentisphaerales bacterium]|nr:hypothetical protein [Sedimentisphaerales bacterium]